MGIWREVTKEKEKTKIAQIINGLSGEPLEVIMSLKEEDIWKENGLDIIIDNLKQRYCRNKEQESYIKVKKLLDMEQQKDETFREYISRYDKATRDCEKLNDIKISDKVHAYQLISNSNMKDMERKLIINKIEGIQENIYINTKESIVNMMESVIILKEKEEKNIYLFLYI